MRRSITTGIEYLPDFPADHYEAVQLAARKFSATGPGSTPPIVERVGFLLERRTVSI